MILKFDEIVFTEKYELKIKKNGQEISMDVPVSISDDEAREVGEILQGNGKSDRIEQILFNDQLDKIKELLIGPNYTGFYLKVLGDFANFTKRTVEKMSVTKN